MEVQKFTKEIFYLHEKKGWRELLLLDEVYYEKTLTKEEFETEINKIVAEMDESIRLNDSFGGAYYLRGIAHGLLGNQEAGTEDFLNAINLGCQDAIDYIEKLMN